MKKFIYLIISIINLGLSALFVLIMPNETVPIHYNIEGEIDLLGNKWIVLLLSTLLVVFGIIYLLRCIIVKNNDNVKKNRKYEERTVLAVFLFLLFISWTVIITSFNRNMYENFSALIAPILCLILGSLIIFISNMYGKVRQNTVLGIKTIATLSSETVWKKTHRIAGYLGVVCGIIMIACGIVGSLLSEISFVLLISALMLFFIVAFIIPAIYAQIIFSKENR